MTNRRNRSGRAPRRYPNRRHIDISTSVELARRRGLNRLSIVLAGMVILIFAGIAITQQLDSDADAPPATQDAVTVPVTGAVPVKVVRIIDGDTFEARAADGSTLTVRLFGVDTPERGEACFDEATEELRDLAGSLVQLLPDERLTDSFDRELRYVYAADGTFIDGTLVAEGFGFAWTEDGHFRDQIVAAEAEARAAERGCLWD